MAKTCLYCGASCEDAAQFCRGCGASLAGTEQPVNQQAPQQPVQQPAPQQFNQPVNNQAAKKTSGTAIASLVVSLVGLLFAGLPCGIIAISLAVSSMNHMKSFPNEGGKGLAIAGLIIGIIDVLAVVLYMVMGS